MSGNLMLDEVSLSSQGKQTKHIKLLQSYKELSTTSQLETMKRYMHSLTFDLKSSSSPVQFSNQDVYRLKESIDRLYRTYKSRGCSLNDIQGIWPILTFCFSKISGLQLYLCFENLISKSEEPPSEVKDPLIKEEDVFQPKKYFQDNIWSKDKYFMRSFRVLQRNISSKKVQQSILICKKMLRILIKDDIDLLMQYKQFQDKFEVFKKELDTLQKERKIAKQSKIMSFLQSSPLFGNMVLSDPGDINHILQYCTKEQYLNNQSYQHQELVAQVKNRPRSLLNLNIDNIKEEDSICPSQAGERTYINSSPTKRRIPVKQEEEQSLMSKATPPRPKKLHRRCPRHKFIQRMYDEQPKKMDFLHQINTDRKFLRQKRQKNQNLQKHLNKKLKKLKLRPFYSDEEWSQTKKSKSKRPKDKKLLDFEIEDEEVQLSIPESQRMQIEASEQITMRRLRPTKNRPLNVAKQIKGEPISSWSPHYSEHNINEHIFNNFDDGQSNSSFAHLRNNQKRAQYPKLATDERIAKKQNPYTQYLKSRQVPPEGRLLEHIDNIEIRKLNFNEQEELFLKFDVFQYLRYLKTLEGKEVKKELFNVSKQLLILQDKVAEIDLFMKVLALTIMTADKSIADNKWQHYEQNYIDPMLKHCLTINIYFFLSEILNNLSVSNFNEDLSGLTKIKEMFTFIFHVATKTNIEYKIITKIYDTLAMPSIVAYLFSNENVLNQSYLNLENPFKIGTNALKFKLSPEDSVISYVVGSFIFEEVVLWGFVKAKTDLTEVRDSYHSRLVNELQGKKSGLSKNQHYYKLIFAIRDFYVAYQPELNQKYFINMSNLIQISLLRLNQDSLSSNNDKETIQKHTAFIQSLCNGQIDYWLSFPGNVNPLNLMNILTIQSRISKQFKKIVPHCKLTMILYPRVLTLFWLRKKLRKAQLYKIIILKYISQIRNSQKIIMFNDSMVAESIFNFILVAYKSTVFDHLSEQNHQFKLEASCNDIKRFTQNKTDRHSQIREMIVFIFWELDSSLGRCLGFCNNSKEVSKNISHLESIQETIIKFMSNFIYPTSNSSYFAEQSALKYSISHYLFGLQFVLHQNCFLRYFKIKLPFETRTHSLLLNKCNEILHFYFGKIADFYELRTREDKNSLRPRPQTIEIEESKRDKEDNHEKLLKNCQVTRYYFDIIFDHLSKKGPQAVIQKEMEINILRELSDNKYLHSISQIYGKYLISCLEKIGTGDKIVIHYLENPIFKYVQQNTNQINISAKKIQKSAIFINNLLSQFSQYLGTLEQDRKNGFTVNAKDIRYFFFKNFVLRLVKEIIVLIVVGFSMRNRQEYLEIPLDNILRSIKQLELVQQASADEYPKEKGYLYFLRAVQLVQPHTSLQDVLDKCFFLMRDKQRQMSPVISKMLVDVQPLLKKYLMTNQQKSEIVLEFTKIIIFILKWSEPSPDCLKKYLVQTQILSKGQSLISKVEISQQNIQSLLSLFDSIQKSKYDFYQMKNTINIFADSLSLQSKEISSEQYYKNIKKALICIGNILKKSPSNCAFALCDKILHNFCTPFLDWSPSHSTNVVKRLNIFLQLLKSSQIQRKCYESIVIGRREQFQRCISMFKEINVSSGGFRFGSFEQMVEECMIGESSDFLELKAMISTMMRQQVLAKDKRDYFCRLLTKMITEIEGSKSNLYLLSWCQDQLSSMNRHQQSLIKLCDLMDIQDGQ